MEKYVIVLISVALLSMIVFSIWKSRLREGAENGYDENTCITLAQKNEARINEIKSTLQDALDIQLEVRNLKIRCDGMTENISKTIEVCQK
jgi:hypothetical protein